MYNGKGVVVVCCAVVAEIRCVVVWLCGCVVVVMAVNGAYSFFFLTCVRVCSNNEERLVKKK